MSFGSCAAFFRKTLQNSQSSLSKSFPGGCKWGVDVHKGTFQNRIFGSNPIGSCLSNLEASRGGDGSTLNVAGYEKKSGLFKSGWGPSWRSVWSMKPDPTAAGPAGASDDGVQDEIGGDCDARGDIPFQATTSFHLVKMATCLASTMTIGWRLGLKASIWRHTWRSGPRTAP